MASSIASFHETWPELAHCLFRYFCGYCVVLCYFHDTILDNRCKICMIRLATKLRFLVFTEIVFSMPMFIAFLCFVEIELCKSIFSKDMQPIC